MQGIALCTSNISLVDSLAVLKPKCLCFTKIDISSLRASIDTLPDTSHIKLVQDTIPSSITGRQWYMIATHQADQDIMTAHESHSRHSCKISNLTLHKMRTSPRYNLILTYAITITQGLHKYSIGS